MVRRAGCPTPVGRDDGTAIVMTVGLSCVIATMATLALALGQSALVRQRVDSAADLAALAGAAALPLGDEHACDRAAEVAALNGALLVDCRPEGLDLVVIVGHEAPPLVRRIAGLAGVEVGQARSVARAGPA